MDFIPVPKKKKLSLKSEKAKAWKAFSLYIRNKPELIVGDLIECYTCGQWKFWKEMQAGHGISGRNNSVLFMEEVVRPQCVGCNVFGRGKQSIFTMKLIKELGMEKYEALIELSNQTVQYKVADFLEIKEKYKKKLEELNICL